MAGTIFTVMEAEKGMPCRLLWKRLLSCELLSTPAVGMCHYQTSSLKSQKRNPVSVLATHAFSLGAAAPLIL
jgi:hypothetical protein